MATTGQVKLNDNVFIYGLYDPRTTNLRYIGKTVDLKQRVAVHLTPSSCKEKTHKGNWIQGLRNLGLKPYVEVLEITNSENWEYAEKHWIAWAKSIGIELTNGTEGGDGVHNPTLETKKKMVSNKDYSYTQTKEYREKMSRVKKGHPAYPNQVKAAIESNKKRPVSPKVLEAFSKNW